MPLCTMAELASSRQQSFTNCQKMFRSLRVARKLTVAYFVPTREDTSAIIDECYQR